MDSIHTAITPSTLDNLLLNSNESFLFTGKLVKHGGVPDNILDGRDLVEREVLPPPPSQVENVRVVADLDPLSKGIEVDWESHEDVKDVESGMTHESTACHNSGDDGVNTNGDTGCQDHVIDIAPQDDADPKNYCVVCTHPSEWVAIGRCGHRVVCRKCMVRIRFFHRNKRCCICRTRCPKVIVAKRDASTDILSTLPLFALREGRVGKLWYHRLTAAYYEDEKEYNAARVACDGILSPFFRPWYWFVLFFYYFLTMGVVFGIASAAGTKHMSTQVRAYALSICVAMSIATTIWSVIKCNQDPLEQERFRRIEKEERNLF
ncbi:hypothetical protein SEVIR_2G409400v4 [Setaria viridis]|uniref:RING-type domain-containing protein n=1 Tax=Setaria viridis TaxID=4556 RepID=A0A4U6W1U7_SETVI|nr:uncharacterized protein LOC117842998 isoform X3 [Setaria viridis]TKW35952.1 hypothetical protein SEVIR_2G409400v2 [Setaria viridis]